MNRIIGRHDASRSELLVVNQRRGARFREVVWVGGQVDINATAEIQHPGNLSGQIEGAMENVSGVLEELGATREDLVKLFCLYVSDGSIDENGILRSIAALLGESTTVAVTVIPVPYLFLPGLLVQIDGYAMRSMHGRALSRSCSTPANVPALPDRLAQGVRCGKMIFVSGQSAVDMQGGTQYAGDIVAQTAVVMERIEATLAVFGASIDDTVKMSRWYVGRGTVADWRPAALACARHYREPGPTATSVPVLTFASPEQRIKIEVIAMLGEDGRRLPRRHSWPESVWDWPMHLPYKHGLKCADMIFLGGQVSLDKKGQAVRPGDLVAQTDAAMNHIGTILRDLGADYRDICKLTTFYQSAGSLEDLQSIDSVYSTVFPDTRPVSSAIALPTLSYPDMVVEIDAFAMAEPDPEHGLPPQ